MKEGRVGGGRPPRHEKRVMQQHPAAVGGGSETTTRSTRSTKEVHVGKSTGGERPPTPETKSLPLPPTDGITALSFTKKVPSQFLASTSWDGSVRMHDTAQMLAVLSLPMESGPLLSLATPVDSNTLLTGGLDGSGMSVE